MIVKLFDGSEYAVTKEQASKIEMLLGKKTFIKINGDTISTSAIAMIKSGATTEHKQLPPPKVDRASRATVEKIRKQLATKLSL